MTPEEEKAYRRAYYQKNKELIRQKAKVRRLARHGLTQQDFLDLLEAQNGVCAICQQECDVIERLSVDHCHKSGRVRGLLCKRCNAGLGFFRDDWRCLLTATRYAQFRTPEGEAL